MWETLFKWYLMGGGNNWIKTNEAFALNMHKYWNINAPQRLWLAISTILYIDSLFAYVHPYPESGTVVRESLREKPFRRMKGNANKGGVCLVTLANWFRWGNIATTAPQRPIWNSQATASIIRHFNLVLCSEPGWPDFVWKFSVYLEDLTFCFFKYLFEIGNHTQSTGFIKLQLQLGHWVYHFSALALCRPWLWNLTGQHLISAGHFDCMQLRVLRFDVNSHIRSACVKCIQLQVSML